MLTAMCFGTELCMPKWTAYTCGWLVLRSECVLLLRLGRISKWIKFTNSQVGFVKAVIDPHLGEFTILCPNAKL